MGFGFPMAAVVASSSLMNSWDLARAVGLGAFGGHAACAAAAKAGLDLVLRERLVANAERLGRHISGLLDEMYQKFNAIGDVRSMGVLGAVELVEERTKAIPARNKAESIVRSAFRRGLLVAKGGKHGNVVRFAAPITVTEEQVNEAFRILNECSRIVLD
jgi:4-aminobutyrate aminotransferase-like enzyme